MSEHADQAGLREQAVSDAATLVSRARAESQQLLAAARAESEAIRGSAHEEASAIIAAAELQAATIQERGRQEFLWRRRQLRQQQDALTQLRQAITSQLDSVTAFAVETAKGLFAAPEPISLEDLNDMGVDQQALELTRTEQESDVQNNLSSLLSSPRRAS
jgi:cell division septum initiation protein DivIVA